MKASLFLKDYQEKRTVKDSPAFKIVGLMLMAVNESAELSESQQKFVNYAIIGNLSELETGTKNKDLLLYLPLVTFINTCK